MTTTTTTTTTTTLTARIPPTLRSGNDHGTAAGDLGRLVVRALRRESRRIDALFINLALPVGIMVVFVYVFGGAITTGASGLDYLDFVVPAVLLLSAGYGAALMLASGRDQLACDALRGEARDGRSPRDAVLGSTVWSMTDSSSAESESRSSSSRKRTLNASMVLAAL
jgi:hypothetical protein